MEEEWRTIKDYPHYAVSNMGRVKVLPHVVYYKDGRVRHNSESIKTLTRKDGYLMVRLFNKQGSKGTLIKVHRLVAQAFIPNPQNKLHGKHKTKDKTIWRYKDEINNS